MNTSGKTRVFRFTRNALALAISAGLATQVQAQNNDSDQLEDDNLIEEVIVITNKPTMDEAYGSIRRPNDTRSDFQPQS